MGVKGMMVARLLLCTVFLATAADAVMDIRGFAGGMAHFGLPFPLLSAFAIVVFLVGASLLVITDLRGLGWLGATALALFTLLTIPIGHPFWQFEGMRRMEEYHIALEHLSVIGGLAVAAFLSLRRA